MALSSCDTRPRWSDLRLVVGSDATELELAACEDARSLFEQAMGKAPPIVEDTEACGRFDMLVGTAASSLAISAAHVPAVAGGFRVRSGDAPKIVIAGHDAEGARNGLYAFMEHLGFRFFRDADVIPELAGVVSIDTDIEGKPAFRWRGDMIWDNYLGPRRYCASVWTEDDWERALLFMARNRMNFLEFYPPLEHVFAQVFPEARGLEEGSVWKSDVKHALAKKVLTRARALGILACTCCRTVAFPNRSAPCSLASNGATGFCARISPSSRSSPSGLGERSSTSSGPIIGMRSGTAARKSRSTATRVVR